MVGSAASGVTKKCTSRSQRRGVEVRPVAFDDELVAGICTIYNESPVRQGRKFWHYGKPPTRVKEENSSYLDRSIFVGAYLGTELIGFVKFVQVGRVARVMQIPSKTAMLINVPQTPCWPNQWSFAAQWGSRILYTGSIFMDSERKQPHDRVQKTEWV